MTGCDASLGRGSVRVGAEDLASLQGHEPAEGLHADAVLDELDATVAEEAVDAAGVEREQFVVGTGIVPGRVGRGGEVYPFIRWQELVVRRARDAVGPIRLGPAPVTTVAPGDVPAGRVALEDRVTLEGRPDHVRLLIGA